MIILANTLFVSFNIYKGLILDRSLGAVILEAHIPTCKSFDIITHKTEFRDNKSIGQKWGVAWHKDNQSISQWVISEKEEHLATRELHHNIPREECQTRDSFCADDKSSAYISVQIMASRCYREDRSCRLALQHCEVILLTAKRNTTI